MAVQKQTGPSMSELTISEYVERFAPTEFATIQDPVTFFRKLNAEHSELAAQLQAEKLSAYLPWSPEYLADPMKMMGVGRRLQMEADREAMQEVVYDRFPPEVDSDGNPLTEPIAEE